MKFLIIGASGFIGRHLSAEARSRGHEVIGTQAHSKVAGLVKFELLQDRIADCIDRGFFEGPEPVQAIICAVVSDMDRCLTDAAMSYRINVENTIRLIDDLRARGARPVYFSTCFVFDGRDGYYSEKSPCSPANEYGRHKMAVEDYLRAQAPESFVARFNKVLGSNPREHHLLSEFYGLISRDEPIVCIEGLWLSPTLVDDVARAVVLACEKGMTGTYHIANSEFFTRDELARQFFHSLGRAPNVQCRPLKDFQFKDNRALKSYLDGSKFVIAVGFRYASMREVFGEFIRQVSLCQQS